MAGTGFHRDLGLRHSGKKVFNLPLQKLAPENGAVPFINAVQYENMPRRVD